jgi:hypothetical protein
MLDHPAFKALDRSQRSLKTDAGDATATPEPQWESAYSDPVEGNVFRIQKLISSFRPIGADEVLAALVG